MEELENNNSEKLFSPVNGNLSHMIYSFVYFLLISIPIAAIFNFKSYYSASALPLLFVNAVLNSFSGLLLLSLALLFTITINKSLVKSLLTIVGIVAVFLVLFGFFFMQLIRIIPILLLVTLITGYLCRGLYKIESKLLKVVLAIIPILIVCAALIIVVFAANNDLSASICDKMPGDNFYNTEKLMCYSYIAREKGDDIISCSKIVQLDCIEAATKKSQELGNVDISICEQLTDTTQKAYCYWGMARAIKDASLCDKTGENKDMCYLNVADSTQNAKLCNNLTSNIFTRKDCIINVAVAKNDITLCNNVIDTEENPNYYADECYSTVAVRNKDPVGCSEVRNEVIKEWCNEQSITK